jgi:hypothetical protein
VNFFSQKKRNLVDFVDGLAVLRGDDGLLAGELGVKVVRLERVLDLRIRTTTCTDYFMSKDERKEKYTMQAKRANVLKKKIKNLGDNRRLQLASRQRGPLCT